MTAELGTSILSRSCPFCGAIAIKDPDTVHAAVDPTSKDFATLSDYWRGFRSKSCFFDYVRCAGCGQLYCRQYFSQDDLDRLYASMPDNTMGAKSEVVNRTQQGYIEFLAKHGPIAGTFMEIGPDIGLAAKAAYDAGNLDRALFVEPNLDVYDDLRASVGGIDATLVATLDEIEEGAGADLAVLVHVLDHLIEPKDHLVELRKRMKPGGRMLVVVHNEGSVLRKALGRRWPPFCLQHPELYRPETLRAMVTAAGFEVLEIARSTNYIATDFIARTGFSLVGVKPSLADHVPSVNLPLKLGNLMLVARA